MAKKEGAQLPHIYIDMGANLAIPDIQTGAQVHQQRQGKGKRTERTRAGGGAASLRARASRGSARERTQGAGGAAAA